MNPTGTSPATVTSGLDSSLFEDLGIGLCIVDAGGSVRQWNGVLETCGVAREAAVGRCLFDVLGAMVTGPDLLAEALAGALAGRTGLLGEEARVDFPGPFARSFRLVIRPLGGGAGLFFLPADDPERVRAHYERILESATDGIMVIDRERRVRVFNAACGVLLGRTPAEVLRTNCVCGGVVRCHLEDGTSLADHLCPARDLFAGAATHRVEEMLATNAAGQERWIETHYSAVRDAAGGVEFVVGVLRDVHERKLLEQRLAQSEKLAALGELTAGIAHEIKNPLGVILSSVEIILDESRPCEMRREAATFIGEEVRRLDNRLRAFLAFARPTPAHPEPTVLNGLVRRTIKGFEAAWPDVRFELDLGVPESIVELDPDHLGQMLTNLVLNAAQAMGGRGTVRVTTRTGETNVEVSIEDNGPGVPEAMRRRIFDPFYTTKADGTGLGLSIVCQLAAAGGGTVRLVPGDLGGARFVLTLPRHPPRGISRR
jgi:PAS domain S-box-containing protein